MTFLNSKTLPRRTVLRGLGATMALPFLDAMLPAFSLRAAAKPVHRFQAFYVPNGMAMEYWTPKGEGRAFELSPILEPLAAYRDQLIVLSGIKANWNYIHAGASGSFLTGTTRGGRNEVEIIADVSMDQLLARHFANETQVASLELSLDKPNNAGACTGNLSCVYTHTLSWRSPTQPLPTEWNPRAVFETLFGDSGSTDSAAREARLQQQKSLLDSVTEKLADLKRELGPQDQVKVEEYTEAIRDVERRIQKAEEQSGLELPALAQPQGAPPVFEDYLALMLDLQLLAFQADLTRVISFMIGKEQSARPYPQIGVPEAHHPLSHHNNVPELVARMSTINRYHTELFSQYLAKLRATPDGDGSLLDHMTILYGSGISQQHCALGRQPAAAAGWRRRRPAGGRTTSHLRRRAVDGQLAGDADGQARRAGGADRRQHGPASNRRHAVRGVGLFMRGSQIIVVALVIAGAGSSAVARAQSDARRLVDVARSADTDAVRALLDNGASIEIDTAEADGTTALHWASHRDDLESADLLIRAGANVNAANDLGATPLWTASQNGSHAMVRRLLAAGADPNRALLLGETPVMVASRSGSSDVVEQLLAKGADVDAQGARGQTALMWAAAQQHADVVSVLLVPRIFNYYTKSGSPCVSSVRWAKRAIDSRIWSADLVHLNGFGSSLWASR